MLLRIESLYGPYGFYSIRTLLLIIYIFVLLAGFIAFMVKARKKEVAATKRIFQGFGLFGFTYAITRSLFLASDYENATNYPFQTNLLFDEVTGAYTVTFVALFLIFYSVERLMLHRKPVFLVISFIAFVICLVALVLTVLKIGVNLVTGGGPPQIAQYTMYVSGAISIIGIIALYIQIVTNSAGSLRKKAASALIGLLVLSMGLLLDMDGLWKYFPAFDPIRLLLSPICFIAGTVTFFFAQS